MVAKCLVCDLSFYVKPCRIKQGFGKTCSSRCKGISKRKVIRVSCFICKTEFERQICKVQEKNYCSRICKEKDQCIGGSLSLPHYKDGAHSYRERALRHYGKTCAMCLYSDDERMLDVHHVDRNRQHNTVSNLQVLCVWCHALHTRGIVGL